MSRTKAWPPPIYSNRGYDRTRVWVDGKLQEFSLGLTGSDEARQKYLRIIAEIEANHGAPQTIGHRNLTVAELVAAYLREAEAYYCESQFWRVKRAMESVTILYRKTLASEFGPVKLKAVRQTFIKAGYCRRLCNQLTGCIRRAWRWASAGELVPHAVSAALSDLPDLRKRRSAAPDHPEIEPVEPEIIEATLPFLLPQVAAIVRFQQYVGCRPGEACLVRPADVIRPWKTIDGVEVWLYDLDKFQKHKNEWRGHLRKMVVGPRAQEVLRPYLDRDPEEYCFCPADAMAERKARRRAARKTKVQPSQIDRSVEKPVRPPGNRYTTGSYSKAVRRAALEAKVANWSPLQIRHLVATDIETRFDQDTARCILGQATPHATAIYAKGLLKAAKVIAQFG
jgi:integrase